MSIKNILCAYSGEEAASSGLAHAVKLAKHHNAWVTGIVEHNPSYLERRFSASLSEDIIQGLHQQDDDRIKELEQRFIAQVSKAGIKAPHDHIIVEGRSRDTISSIARAYDLIVVGPHENAMSEDHFSAHPDMIALQSGRPVLSVPDGYASEGLADHAIVAWDGKRSAARALGDAMDSLEDKAKVTVLTVGKTEFEMPDGGGIMSHLERHGINAVHLHVERKGRSIARTIEDSAAEINAKLIVMGAFEHSKFSHDLFGGVTTEVMKTAEVPVFMSH